MGFANISQQIRYLHTNCTQIDGDSRELKDKQFEPKVRPCLIISSDVVVLSECREHQTSSNASWYMLQ